MFTNDSILHIAMQQSAIEYNCAIDAFMQQQSIITLPCASTSARKYLDVPFRCSLVSNGKNDVACAEKVLHNELRQYLDGPKCRIKGRIHERVFPARCFQNASFFAR